MGRRSVIARVRRPSIRQRSIAKGRYLSEHGRGCDVHRHREVRDAEELRIALAGGDARPREPRHAGVGLGVEVGVVGARVVDGEEHRVQAQRMLVVPLDVGERPRLADGELDLQVADAVRARVVRQGVEERLPPSLRQLWGRLGLAAAAGVGSFPLLLAGTHREMFMRQ